MKLVSFTINDAPIVGSQCMHFGEGNQLTRVDGDPGVGKTFFLYLLYQTMFPTDKSLFPQRSDQPAFGSWLMFENNEGKAIKLMVKREFENKLTVKIANKQLTATGVKSIFPFDVDLTSFAVNPRSFFAHSGAVQKRIIAKLAGMEPTSLGMTIEQAGKEMAKIDIENVDKVLKEHRERKERIKLTKAKILDIDIHIGGLDRCNSYLLNNHNHVFNSAASADIAKEIHDNEKKIDVLRAKRVLENDQLLSLESVGVNALQAVNDRLRYDGLRDFLTNQGRADDTKLLAFEAKLRSVAAQMMPKVHVNYKLEGFSFAFDQEVDKTPSTVFAQLNMALKWMAAHRSGCRCMVVDDCYSPAFDWRYLNTMFKGDPEAPQTILMVGQNKGDGVNTYVLDEHS